MRKDFQIRRLGRPGRHLLAVLLANAFGVQNNYEVAQTQSYGPAARGGACKAEPVYPDERIDYVKADELDAFVSFANKQSFDKFKGDVNANTVVFADSTFISEADVAGLDAKAGVPLPGDQMRGGQLRHCRVRQHCNDGLHRRQEQRDNAGKRPGGPCARS